MKAYNLQLPAIPDTEMMIITLRRSRCYELVVNPNDGVNETEKRWKYRLKNNYHVCGMHCDLLK